MANAYAQAAINANKLLAVKGQVVEVRRILTEFDPATSEDVPVSAEVFQANAVLLGAGSGVSYDRSLEPQQVVGSEKKLLLSTIDNSFTPDLLDEIVIGDNLWIIHGFSSIDPAGVSVIFKVGIMLKGLAEPNNLPAPPIHEW